jgi:hypothetical protein
MIYLHDKKDLYNLYKEMPDIYIPVPNENGEDFVEFDGHSTGYVLNAHWRNKVYEVFITQEVLSVYLNSEDDCGCCCEEEKNDDR